MNIVRKALADPYVTIAAGPPAINTRADRDGSCYYCGAKDGDVHSRGCCRHIKPTPGIIAPCYQTDAGSTVHRGGCGECETEPQAEKTWRDRPSML